MNTPESQAAQRVLTAISAFASAGDAERFKTALWNSAEAIRSYLLSFRLEGTDEGFAPMYVNDALPRFLRTLEYVPLPPPGRILEIGSNPYFFHLLLKKFFPGSAIDGANFFDHNIFSTELGSITQKTTSEAFGESFDFSSKLFNIETVDPYPYDENTFDLIFFCETLEHLTVNPLSVFAKLRRILKPNGYLVVTLPNAVRIANFALMLDGYNFFDLYQLQNGIHGRHNREFTLTELEVLLGQNNFQVVRAETHDRYNYDEADIWTMDYAGSTAKLKRRRKDLLRILKKARGKTTDRGDNLYLLAQKPSPLS